MKQRIFCTLAIAGLIAFATITPSCKPDEKPCDTAMQDSLNIWEIRLKEREMSLREREMAIMERERSLGITGAAAYQQPPVSGSITSGGDERAVVKGGRKDYLEPGNKAAYKKPVLDFPGQFPESSERVLEKDVDHKSSWGMKVMLNEIYARHGFIFKEKDLRRHFAEESWYKGTERNMSKLTLTPIEIQNIAFIKKHQVIKTH